MLPFAIILSRALWQLWNQSWINVHGIVANLGPYVLLWSNGANMLCCSWVWLIRHWKDFLMQCRTARDTRRHGQLTAKMLINWATAHFQFPSLVLSLSIAHLHLRQNKASPGRFCNLSHYMSFIVLGSDYRHSCNFPSVLSKQHPSTSLRMLWGELKKKKKEPCLSGSWRWISSSSC